jgi:hypothetical protein
MTAQYQRPRFVVWALRSWRPSPRSDLTLTPSWVTAQVYYTQAEADAYVARQRSPARYRVEERDV